MPIGQIVGGEYGEVLIRQKSGETIEIGDLLSIEDVILQILDLEYGSLLEQNDIERMSGMELEGYEETSLMEEEIRNYIYAKAKPLVRIKDGKARIPKVLPSFFGNLERVSQEDFDFLEEPENSLYLGKVRSGSQVLNVPIHINGKEALSHHIMIPATTGRGKSNLVKVMLWHLIPKEYAGLLVIDPHDEYYGRNEVGAKDHPEAGKKVDYYSTNPPAGGYQLRINLSILKPWNLQGIVELSEAQSQALYVYYSQHGKNWLEALLTSDQEEADMHGVRETTLDALKRKLKLTFDLSVKTGEVRARGNIFVNQGSESLVKDIVDAIEEGKKVILDTSSMPENKELLIAGIITDRIFKNYKDYKEKGELEEKPTVGIVIEEAPRVLGDRAGRNVFHQIAREGRKFRVGLVAITQLSSMIPREILANMNTKIILGNEMKSERDAIIGSAAQDLSKDSKNIASLDKGEAIVSSIFTKFAVPIKIDLFEDMVEEERGEDKKLEFFG
ncbi:MAG: ATP-binding protein [Candidatus Thermoplasmatota archaeon]|nr:ATP-binding protein [Candidatus Thermoplasmatota archaeon]